MVWFPFRGFPWDMVADMGVRRGQGGICPWSLGVHFTKFRLLIPGMLILVLVLKDSLRTFFKSLSWSFGSGPFPCPGPCGLVLVLVFSPCKDLFPLFHYSDLFAYYCSVNAYNYF